MRRDPLAFGAEENNSTLPPIQLYQQRTGELIQHEKVRLMTGMEIEPIVTDWLGGVGTAGAFHLSCTSIRVNHLDTQ